MLSVVLENDVLVSLDDCKALVKDCLSVLLTHEGLKLGELTRGNVDHFVFAHVARYTGVLTLVIDLGSLLGAC